MATSVLSMVLETKKRGNAGPEVTRELQGVTKGLANAALAVGAVAGGLVVAQRLYRATVGAAMEYADAVGDLASITGESTENTSRFMTVLGDFGIEMSQITAAGRAMRDEGLAPTLGTLAQLSDQYLALAPGMDRINFLQQTFGRQGAEFVDVLEQGSAAILARAAAVAHGNVLTAEEIRQADELRLSMRELNDEWTGFTRTLSFEAIPFIGSTVEQLGDLVTVLSGEMIPPERLTLLSTFIITIQDVAGALGLWEPALLTADGAGRQWVLGMDNQLDRLDRIPGSTDGAVDGLNDLTAAWLTNQIAAGSAGLQMDVVREAIAFLAAHPDIEIDMTVLTTYLQTGGALAIGGAYDTTSMDGGGGAYGPPGGWANWAAAHPGELWMPGMQHGGSFDVMGPAGVDRVPVAFMATAGERVTVQTPAQAVGTGRGITFTGDFHFGSNLDLASFEKMLIRCLRG